MMASDSETGQVSNTLRWHCSEGHQRDAKFDYLKRGNRWCPTCNEMLMQQARKTELRDTAAKQGGKVLSEKIRDMKSEVRLECTNGHQSSTSFSGVRYKGTWCPSCAQKTRANFKHLTTVDAQKASETHGGHLLSST
ncbi:unnamed protein product [Polarella glacialis]|uniref:Uncharacterized protein n=1 Tax=Polarella glacialis TaxID=89957 RepID=A0A813EKJ5_POLGL|nr:unnamed protein product [Polarella glacialis]